MGETFAELRRRINADPARRAHVEEHKRAISLALALGRLRKDGTRPPAEGEAMTREGETTSLRAEHVSDSFLETLRTYVEALGGQLSVAAVFPDCTIDLLSLETEHTLDSSYVRDSPSLSQPA